MTTVDVCESGYVVFVRLCQGSSHLSIPPSVFPRDWSIYIISASWSDSALLQLSFVFYTTSFPASEVMEFVGSNSAKFFMANCQDRWDGEVTDTIEEVETNARTADREVNVP